MFKEIDTLTQGECSQLHKSIDYPPFYISIPNYEYSSFHKTYIYHIEVGIKLDESSIIIRKIDKRYSEIYEFWKRMCQEYNILNMETFPPKIWIWKNDETKIKNRYEQLKKCLSRLCEMPGLIHNSDFKTFMVES